MLLHSISKQYPVKMQILDALVLRGISASKLLVMLKFNNLQFKYLVTKLFMMDTDQQPPSQVLIGNYLLRERGKQPDIIQNYPLCVKNRGQQLGRASFSLELFSTSYRFVAVFGEYVLRK